MDIVKAASEKIGSNPVTWTLCAVFVLYAVGGLVAVIRRDITFTDWRNGLAALGGSLGVLSIGRGIAAAAKKPPPRTTAARTTSARRRPVAKPKPRR